MGETHRTPNLEARYLKFGLISVLPLPCVFYAPVTNYILLYSTLLTQGATQNRAQTSNCGHLKLGLMDFSNFYF